MAKTAPTKQKSALRFEAVKIGPLFTVLDAVAWLDNPTSKEIAQFGGIDPRTAGKLLKNARFIRLVESADDSVCSRPAVPIQGYARGEAERGA